jgi:glycosyltransferase involved in cell wall biosynthesis
MSNAILEAVCVGLPVVTTNVSGAAELVKNGEGGFVVPIRDEKALADALRKILKDENLREKMMRTNKTRAKEFKQDMIVNQWEELIKKIVDNYGSTLKKEN